MYDIVFTKQAHGSFQSIPHKIALRIRSKLEQLAADPYTRNPNVTKLQDRAGYRLRVGEYDVVQMDGRQTIIIELSASRRFPVPD